MKKTIIAFFALLLTATVAFSQSIGQSWTGIELLKQLKGQGLTGNKSSVLGYISKTGNHATVRIKVDGKKTKFKGKLNKNGCFKWKKQGEQCNWTLVALSNNHYIFTKNGEQITPSFRLDFGKKRDFKYDY